MEEGRTYKKYNSHIITYKDFLNQQKQPRQYNSHINSFNNKQNIEKQLLLIKQYEYKRKLKDLELNKLKQFVNNLPTTYIIIKQNNI